MLKRYSQNQALVKLELPLSNWNVTTYSGMDLILGELLH
jgi:hypothetical protein